MNGQEHEVERPLGNTIGNLTNGYPQAYKTQIPVKLEQDLVKTSGGINGENNDPDEHFESQ
jgi:hypothetical protein